jgi:hypothetical protein
MMPPMVAALYVEKNGPYYGLPDVDPWDKERDARNYAGPWPVVAHPPCARWCRLAPLVQSMYGHAIGDDGGTFAAALDAVRTYGGILEHPAHSLAWSHFSLPAPARYGWATTFDDPGYATEIAQVAYGHPARKRTWLYYVGPTPPTLDWSEPPATAMVSDFGPGNSRRRGDEWTPGIQYAEASRTPERFRDALLAAARGASPALTLAGGPT